jgi:hypothetical protein
MTRSFFLIAASALLLSQVGGATALPKVGQGTAAFAAPLTILVRQKQPPNPFDVECKRKRIPLGNCVCHQGGPGQRPVCSDNRKKIQ